MHHNPQFQNSYPCPVCRGPMTFIAQYRQWYCGRCNKYPFAHQHINRPKAQRMDYHNYNNRSRAPPTNYRSYQRQQIRSQNQTCPDCGFNLTYSYQYSHYWCNHCKRFTPPDPKPPLRISETRPKVAFNFGKSFGFGQSSSSSSLSSSSYKKDDADKVPDRLVSMHSPDGKFHRTEYRVRGGKVYERGSGLPLYKIRDGKLYKTIHHPDGVGGFADYKIDGDRLRPTLSLRSQASRFNKDDDEDEDDDD